MSHAPAARRPFRVNRHQHDLHTRARRLEDALHWTAMAASAVGTGSMVRELKGIGRQARAILDGLPPEPSPDAFTRASHGLADLQRQTVALGRRLLVCNALRPVAQPPDEATEEPVG